MRRATVLSALLVLASVSRNEAQTSAGPAKGAADLPTARQSAQAAARCKSGDQALRARDAVAAAAAYGEALAAFPGHPGAHIGLGHAAMLRRDFPTALAEYDRAASAWTTLQEAIERCRAEKNRKAVDGATAILEFTSRMNDDSAESVVVPGMPHSSDGLKRAVLENELHDLGKSAQASYTRDAAPPPAIAFFRGTALYRLGRIDDAVAAWLEVERREPTFGPVYNNLVEGLIRLGREADARATAKRAQAQGFKVHPDLLARLGQ